MVRFKTKKQIVFPLNLCLKVSIYLIGKFIGSYES